jgi:ubiquinone/menaquinone biosynthesis C-methylase UbiE
VRPESLEGDWNRLYSEFPDVYAAWARIRHEPEPIDVITERWPFTGATMIDVGSGSGASTFELAEHAAQVIGIEPNPAMRALAEQHAAAAGVQNVAFAPGSAEALPCADAAADIVACITTSFWPAEEVVPAFVAEAERVLRPGATVIVLNTPPGWYGGDFHDIVTGDPDYEEAVDALFAAAGFGYFDFETVQDYGTPERAVETYGFIFGSRAIEQLSQRRQSRISWRWRVRHRRR